MVEVLDHAFFELERFLNFREVRRAFPAEGEAPSCKVLVLGVFAGEVLRRTLPGVIGHEAPEGIRELVQIGAYRGNGTLLLFVHHLNLREELVAFIAEAPAA